MSAIKWRLMRAFLTPLSCRWSVEILLLSDLYMYIVSIERNVCIAEKATDAGIYSERG